LIERVILFILGAGLAALIGFRIVITAQTPVIFFGGIALAALTVGVVSAKYGMRFWERVRHIGWWV